MNIDIVEEQARVPVTIFRLADRINLGNAEELEDKAREVFAQGTRYLLIDLTKVPSMTSAGLRSLQAIYKLFEQGSSSKHKEAAGKQAAGKSAHMKLLNPNVELRRVLELVGFDVYIDIQDNERRIAFVPGDLQVVRAGGTQRRKRETGGKICSHEITQTKRRTSSRPGAGWL
jgi:anti-anti-sigma factor